MNKTVDINERTLEKEKKSFISFCKTAEVFLSIALALMIVGAIAAFIMIIMANIMNTGIFTEEPTSEGIFYSVYFIAICIGMSITFNFGVKVFRELKNGETPFRYEIADKIKAAGMSLFGTGAVCMVFDIARGILVSNKIFEGIIEMSFDFDCFIWCAVILAIAYIFNYGCKLQQESDETI